MEMWLSDDGVVKVIDIRVFFFFSGISLKLWFSLMKGMIYIKVVL